MAKKGNRIGSWAFLIGVILAVIFAFAAAANWVVWTLIVIGLIVGLLNIAVKEIEPFLMAGAIFVIVSALGKGVFPAGFMQALLNNLMYLFVPATIIVALRSLWALGRA